MSRFNVGAVITFGHYPQSSASAGPEPIEWIVLDISGETATLISRYGLDAKAFHNERVDVTWEACALRKWLNGDFLRAAFNNDEQEQLVAMTVKADRNPRFSTGPGKDTLDRVFLLSVDEARRYFASDNERVCMPTAAAIANGAYTWEEEDGSGNGACWWWLRTQGNIFPLHTAGVDSAGSLSVHGYFVYGDDAVVRPAVVLRLS